jgi:hypothetical protein
VSAAASNPPWRTRNQEHLAACVQRVRRRLEQHLARQRGERASSTIEMEAPPAAVASGRPPAIEMLASAFGLSPFERRVLLLCAGVELDAEVARLCATLHGDPAQRAATFGLALAILPEAHWSALSFDAPLRRHRLVEVLPGASLTGSTLRIEERVLHYLAGVDGSDPRLAGVVAPLSGQVDVDEDDDADDAPYELAPSHFAIAQRVADAWSRSDGPVVVQLCGGGRDDKRAIAVHAARALGLRAMRLVAGAVPSSPPEIDALARLWGREATLSAAALVIDAEDVTDASSAAALAEAIGAPVAIASRERWPTLGARAIALDVDKPRAEEQAALWRSALGARAGEASDRLGAITAQFSLSSSAIGAVAHRAQEATEAANGAGALADALWSECRAAARPRMDDQAQRVTPSASWEDLVLPAFETQLLRDVALHVRARTQVYEAWGLAAKGARGLSITALFSGASGTGKTMAAEVIANELALDLYRIDLSQVVSKYIGETEKNLRRVFDAAEEGGAILLFDEADALFGKRSEVKDSHDRYANIEVSYLLQRMEAYRGLAILTTNLKDSLDGAFLRRIRFAVSFPFPNAEQREAIWRRVLPASVPRDELRFGELARLNIAGGNIRNIAVYAAFLAAGEGVNVGMRHLARAARVEFAKLERPLSDAEVRGWT